MPNAKKKKLTSEPDTKNKQLTSPRVTKRKKRAATFVLPVVQADGEAIRSFMTDCLVPVLAKEFMRQRGKAQE
jgi:hypothetical protein